MAKGKQKKQERQKVLFCFLCPFLPFLLPSSFSKIKPQSHAHGARFDRSSRREEIAQARRGEINELRAEAEDRRVERVERLDLKLDFTAFSELKFARQSQVERVRARSSPRVARQVACGPDSRKRKSGGQRWVERLAGATPDDSAEVTREIRPVVIHVVEVAVGASDAEADRAR